MKHALLIRHGESEHHESGMTGGWTDLPLTARGRAQAERAAARVAGLQLAVSVVYASDLSRASETGSIIASRAGCDLILVPELREIYNGRATGMTQTDAAAIELPRTEPLARWVAYEGAESWVDMQLRVFGFMERLDLEGPETVVLVAHGGSLNAVVRWWLGMPVESARFWEFRFAAASYTDLTVNFFGERQVAQLSDTSHLVGEG